ncbi:expressed unknown protein [Seminavis robusta]|uniref:Uncharacterized protein n=1 Tax=Seminavis robusta TaxID=568900 RepID=A0A9N8H1K1_9STRA|nr:expressed unknown protein [Seminavis robusta]|eukprot:Sro4_g003820.1 n/a (215) ;mRNA; f:249943-250665
MRTTAAVSLLLVAGASAFTSQPLSDVRTTGVAVNMAYVPDGFTAESYKKFKEAEAKKKATKNLGGVGPRGFQSRSMQAFQEAMERGEAEHLLPVFNAEERIKKGELKREDIPYMQRGGSWDNSDIKGARKKQWSSRDKEYASGGFKKEQSVSIFGYGEGLDWTGSKARQGPSESIPGAAPVFGRNYKAPNVNTMKIPGKGQAEKPKKKGFFGLF